MLSFLVMPVKLLLALFFRPSLAEGLVHNHQFKGLIFCYNHNFSITDGEAIREWTFETKPDYFNFLLLPHESVLAIQKNCFLC
jgi:hypothetical protein